jgi:hypothetical protein
MSTDNPTSIVASYLPSANAVAFLLFITTFFYMFQSCLHQFIRNPINSCFNLFLKFPITTLLSLLGIVLLILVLAYNYDSDPSPTRVLQVPWRALETSQPPSIRPPPVPDSRLIICGLLLWFVVLSHAKLTARQFQIPKHE